jgi:Zn-dependent peptidase ImmA (M78 family)/DNA-binding XRE family transcriptional regulator
MTRAAINPAVLAWFRNRAALSIEAAAKKAGLAASQYAQVEAGAALPTIRQAKLLAKAMNVSLAALYLPEPPEDFLVHRPHDFRQIDVAADQQISPALARELDRAQIQRSRAEDLFLELDQGIAQFDFRCTLDQRPEDVAAHFRKSLDYAEVLARRTIPPKEAFDYVADQLGRRGVLVFQMTDVAVDEARAFSVSAEVLPVIVVNAKDAWVARLFSLIHEATHLALGSEGICTLDDSGSVGRAAADVRLEAFCNSVAASFLMPRDQFDAAIARVDIEDLDSAIASLARRFGVSKIAAARRLLTLGRITADTYRAKQDQFELEFQEVERIRRERLRQANGGPNPVSMRLLALGKDYSRLVLEGYHRDLISLSQVSDYLGLRLKHISRVQERLTD